MGSYSQSWKKKTHTLKLFTSQGTLKETTKESWHMMLAAGSRDAK